MGQFFCLKNSKFFSGLKKLAQSAAYYYCRTYGVIYNNIETRTVSEKPYARMYIIYNIINIYEKKEDLK